MAIDLMANIAPRSNHDFGATTAPRVLATDIDVERAAAAVTDDILADVWPLICRTSRIQPGGGVGFLQPPALGGAGYSSSRGSLGRQQRQRTSAIA